MKIIKIILISFLFFGIFSGTVFAECADKSQHKLEINLGPLSGCVNIGDYLAGIYRLSLGVGVFVAAIVIVMAGIKYATSGDNAGKQKEARGDIFQAIFGLLILFGSVVILRTINPDLADLSKWTKLSSVDESNKPVTPITFEEQTKCMQLASNFRTCYDKNCNGKCPAGVKNSALWLNCCIRVKCTTEREAQKEANCDSVSSSNFNESACDEILMR